MSLLKGCQMFVRNLHTTEVRNHIVNLTRLRVVDNSKIGVQAMTEGKPPRVIRIYNKKCNGRGLGRVGDKVLVAIKGEMRKGIIVGCVQKQKPNIPSFDSNNVVLIDDTGSPLGNRIFVPLPSILRTILKEKSMAKGVDYSKLLAIAPRYI